ncbi:hypothetical protein SAMN05216359_1032 [Roseateles sp. YR242]|uniref:site-2 protease family protein n=1 Tax=Roseateles sp. YR242 TaxID=1855305 RepID=UPI0008BB734B|nr:site-2 protease family protein [Roseateles sp. YR242]SEK76562.1 hypothetical protein SAMN05216359_1032 [Roseateles sp. YR242]
MRYALNLLLLIFSGLKFGKLLIPIGSMLLTMWVYAMMFGWRYAVGLMAMLLIHQLGYVLAARYKGMQAGWPTFIPFVGAFSGMKEAPQDAQTEAFVGMGGPLLGTVGATLCYFMARSYEADWLMAVAYAGLFINLISLIPLAPLPGGRITAVLSPRIWLLGVPLLGALFLYQPSPMLLLIAILALPHLVKAWRYRNDSDEALGYYAVPTAVKWEYGTYYLALAAYLAVMTHDVHELLTSVREASGHV